jgi:Flavodoxin-like fold
MAVAAQAAVFAGKGLDRDQTLACTDVRRAFHRFAAADAYLFSVPMWNAGVPYVFKQFIDVISQPGLLFGFDAAEGYAAESPGGRQPGSTPAPPPATGSQRPSAATSKRPSSKVGSSGPESPEERTCTSVPTCMPTTPPARGSRRTCKPVNLAADFEADARVASSAVCTGRTDGTCAVDGSRAGSWLLE